MKSRDMFVEDLVGGADPALAINVRMVTELAWHSLFNRTMLRRPDRDALDAFVGRFHGDQLSRLQGRPDTSRLPQRDRDRDEFRPQDILVAGTEYAGENKKSIFTLLNYLLPDKGVMPMHCSANHAQDNPVDAACSSACRAPARRRCRPIPNAP